MKQLFAIETNEQLPSLQSTGDRLFQQLITYKDKLHKEFELNEVPSAVLWTTADLATSTFSEIPIPAFTSRNMIIMSPDMEEWKRLFKMQLEEKNLPEVQSFYENLSENHILVILAHELTHHINLFPDEFEEYGDSIWFEEGMCFYLPPKLLLTETEFTTITEVEERLVQEFESKHGKHDLEEFGSGAYEGSLTSIMYDYWRSYLRVNQLVEGPAKGDVHTVFKWYNEWHQTGKALSFTKYLLLNPRINLHNTI
ncbi:hypothetical protein MKY84_13730 [Chryseomicrobium sp. FSL W7-1435]|uniref:hypothetical protein n=1 Tax=Chryseomicrobium sp. FSL W7-1435 TaxID=2921704 RepID=UPI0031599948